ncbi:hypothetical protein INT45_013347 [Circinella minor]|uniref:RanBD1 domain-containing protein n=1 Tax=Circinella minor TaxID=1195481 RepID=A0A8H7RWZ2_9FUNG|nr:hypothetical protein INT45_013347 [Circinella minor]
MSSSPNESISDFDDAASTKKRGRDQSVEPQDQPTQITQKEVEDSQPTSSAPKKSKRIDEEDLDSTNTTSVRTIRRNLKDMSTADRSNSTSDNEPEDATMHQDEEEQDNAMHQDQKEDNSHISNNSIPAETEIKENEQSVATKHQQQQQEQFVSGDKEEKVEEEKSSKNKHAFAAFGGNSHDDDDWGEFEEEDKEEQAKKEQEPTDKPKYTFGATSGFGTKGWSLQQTATPPVTHTTQKPTFGGFSGSGFGAFASSEKPSTSFSSLATSSTINNTSNNTNNNNNNNSSTFGSFSSFARAAAASKTTTTTTTTTNDSNTSLSSPQTKESTELSNTNHHTEDDTNNNDTSHSSTTTPQRNATLSPELPSAVIDMNTIHTNNNNTIKSKPLQQPPTEVITGEENEDTLYQTRAKLYEMEHDNWKERGLGTLRIKQHKKNNQQRRVIMRADSVYRLILNVRLVSYLKFDINQEKFVQFLLIEKEENNEGKIENRFRKFALKVSNASAAEELLHQLVSALPKETDEEQ